MSRRLRIVIPGLAHHLTATGLRRQPIFFCDQDRLVFLDLLKKASAARGVRLLGYSLMTTHVHLVPKPSHARALASLCQDVLGNYAAMSNRWRQTNGHLFHGRYWSCPLDELHLCRTLRYVDLNAKRAHLVVDPADYPWSSAQAHLTGHDPTGLLDLDAWQELWPDGSWASYLQESGAFDDLPQIRHHTKTGIPWGDEDFHAWIERKTGRRIR